MSDEFDCWLEKALGVDVSTYLGCVTIEPSGGPQYYATGVEIDPADSDTGNVSYFLAGLLFGQGLI